MMDYSGKGILVMLQDLQRIHFGKVSMYVDMILSECVIVSACVFDKSGEPHTTSFYEDEMDERRKEK